MALNKIVWNTAQMPNLSKSKILAYRQCHKRLWLEIHRSDLREDSASTEASFNIGKTVGDIAREIYDPQTKGYFLDLAEIDFSELFNRTELLVNAGKGPVFEAGFIAKGALCLADILIPVKRGRKPVWRMVEVKSSTSVNDYHRDDAAIQAYVSRSAGLALEGIALAHIDNSWVYPGNEDYQGLLVEEDLTEEAFSRGAEVGEWIAEAHAIVKKRKAPKIGTGDHCNTPYACGFFEYCASEEPQAEYPVQWLPRVRANALKQHIANGHRDLRDVPDELLNEKQLRVKHCSLSGKVFFDKKGAAKDLSGCKLPAYFLDFETVQFAVPIWKGTRPYQQIPFQFSAHRLSRTGKLEHQDFLDLSGGDPSKEFAEALIKVCGNSGPIFVYNIAFERTRIHELAARFPKLAKSLVAVADRLIDLLPVATERYYHPTQQGSWSIKKVLPAVAPDLRYDQLDGVQDGGMAMDAFKEAISDSCSPPRRDEVRNQLRKYCELDTMAMVRLYEFLLGKKLISRS